MKKKKYSTSYVQNHHKYGSHVWAVNWKEAERLCKMRNIDEKVYSEDGEIKDGYGRKKFEHELNPDFKDLSDYEFVHRVPEILHTACFLSFVAVSSGRKYLSDLAGDEGVLHELIHLLNGADLTTRHIRRVRGKFMELQKTISEHYQ